MTDLEEISIEIIDEHDMESTTKITNEDFGAYLISIARDLNIIKTNQEIMQEKLDALLCLQGTKVADKGENSFEPIERLLRDLPLSSTNDVESFEEAISKNEEHYKLMVQYLAQIGGQNLSQIIKLMVKRLVTNNLAVQYSLHGKKNKFSFKNTILFSLIKDAVRISMPDGSYQEIDIEKLLSSWLRHARARVLNEI